MSLLLAWGAYARDKNTSARLCAKKTGGRICGTLRYNSEGRDVLFFLGNAWLLR